ncbi:MAG TPA: hypothetical protein VEH62_05855, partial [Gemmatimonadales bacterium]|nr:hypothetical protein [Gemmatimonadales bacterium]
ALLGPGVALIDSAQETAAAVARELARSTLHAPATTTAHVHFVVSDDVRRFVKVGRMFLGERVKDVELKVIGEG